MDIKKFEQKDRYGNSVAVEFDIPKPESVPNPDPASHPGQPKGSDTVPAWLTPGEFVVNAEAVDMFGPQIEAMNEIGRQQQIPQYRSEGGSVYSNALQATADKRGWTPEQVDAFNKWRTAVGQVESNNIPTRTQGDKPDGIGRGKYQFELSTGSGASKTAANRVVNYLPKIGVDFNSLPEGDRKILMSDDPDFSKLSEDSQDLAFLSHHAMAPNSNLNALVSGEVTPGEAWADWHWAGSPDERATKLEMWNNNSNYQQQQQVPQEEGILDSLMSKFQSLFQGDDNVQYRNTGGPILPTQQTQNDMDSLIRYMQEQTQPQMGLDQNGNQVFAAPEVPAPQQQLTVPQEQPVPTEQGVWDSIKDFLPSVRYTPSEGKPSQEGVTPAMREPGDFYVREDTSVADGETQRKAIEDAYINGDITEDEYNIKTSDVAANVGSTKLRQADANKEEIDKINEQIKRAKRVGRDTSALEKQANELKAVNSELTSKVPPLENTPPPPSVSNEVTPEENEGLDVIDQLTNDDASKSEADQLENTDNSDIEGAGNNAADEDPSMFESVVGWLKDAAGEFLDDRMLKQAAIMYVGSRALGYNHGGSLRWTANNYLNRVNNKVKTADQIAIAGKHTDKSVEKFRETGDYTDLKLNPVAPNISIDKTDVKTVYNNKTGKTEKVYSYKNEDTKDEGFVTLDGREVNAGDYETDPYKIKGSKEWNNRVLTSSKDMSNTLKDLQKQFGTYGEGDKKMTVTDMNPNVAGRQVAEWAAQNDVPVEQLGSLTESAYEEMRKYADQSGKRPRDIRTFLNQLTIRNRVSSPELFLAKDPVNEDGSPRYVDATKLAQVNSVISDFMKKQGTKGNVSDIANSFYTAKIGKWSELSEQDKQKYNGMANDDESGFLVYVLESLGMDNRAK